MDSVFICDKISVRHREPFVNRALHKIMLILRLPVLF